MFEKFKKEFVLLCCTSIIAYAGYMHEMYLQTRREVLTIKSNINNIEKNQNEMKDTLNIIVEALIK